MKYECFRTFLIPVAPVDVLLLIRGICICICIRKAWLFRIAVDA
jgi:hypothetical protein